MRRIERPDEVVVHAPGACSGCGGTLTGEDRPVLGVIRRQVFDIGDDHRAGGRASAALPPLFLRRGHGKRRGRFPVVSFTFLGFMFCPRPSRNHRGEQFLAFLPAISPQALTKIGRVVRRWRLHRRIFSTLEELARAINPIVAGWMAYYGRFYRSKLSALLARINAYLVRWIRNKYRRLDRTRAAHAKLAELAAGQPRLFRHWAWVTTAWR